MRPEASNQATTKPDKSYQIKAIFFVVDFSGAKVKQESPLRSPRVELEQLDLLAADNGVGS